MTRFLLDDYAIVSEWIQENKVHNEDRIQEVLQVSQEIDSLILYRRRYHATLREIECVKITAIQFAFLKMQRNK